MLRTRRDDFVRLIADMKTTTNAVLFEARRHFYTGVHCNERSPVWFVREFMVYSVSVDIMCTDNCLLGGYEQSVFNK